MNDIQAEVVKLPFFDYRYYNKFDNFCPWQLDSVVANVGFIHKHLTVRSKSKTVTSQPNTDYLSFNFWIKTHVEEEFYKMTRNSRHQHDYLECTFKPINYGTSSHINQMILKHPVTKEELLTSLQCLVIVDPISKRPIPIPKDLKEQFDKQGVPSIPTNKIHRLQPPSKVFEFKVEVSSSSIDINQHMKSDEYSRLCFDCASFAVKKKFYKFFTQDMDHYHVRDTLRLHVDESKVGDILKAITWQEQNRPEMLYFLVFKNNDTQAIFEFTCIFYKNSLSIPKL